MAGANLSYAHPQRLWARYRELLGSKARGVLGVQTPNSRRVICTKAGVPANNTAADNPDVIKTLCIDSTNNDVYECTAFTADASATTWVKVID